MNIYHLFRKEDAGADEARAFVIIAQHPTHARNIAAENCGDEEPQTWQDESKTVCRRIGNSVIGFPSKAQAERFASMGRVVCRDFCEA